MSVKIRPDSCVFNVYAENKHGGDDPSGLCDGIDVERYLTLRLNKDGSVHVFIRRYEWSELVHVNFPTYEEFFDWLASNMASGGAAKTAESPTQQRLPSGGQMTCDQFRERIAAMAALPDDWDECEGKKFDAAALYKIANIVESWGCPLPDRAVPVEENYIALEWDLARRLITISVHTQTIDGFVVVYRRGVGGLSSEFRSHRHTLRAALDLVAQKFLR